MNPTIKQIMQLFSTLSDDERLDVAESQPEQLPALEAQLNQLVYQVYGLNEDDIAVIENI